MTAEDSGRRLHISSSKRITIDATALGNLKNEISIHDCEDITLRDVSTRRAGAIEIIPVARGWWDRLPRWSKWAIGALGSVLVALAIAYLTYYLRINENRPVKPNSSATRGVRVH